MGILDFSICFCAYGFLVRLPFVFLDVPIAMFLLYELALGAFQKFHNPERENPSFLFILEAWPSEWP